MNLEPGICRKCKKHTAVKLSPGDELLCKDCFPVGSTHMEANTCEDCKIKEGNVKLQQNDKLMCDLFWGRPMPTKYILDRSTILIDSLSDVNVNEESTPSSEGKENTLELEDLDDDDDMAAILDSSPLDGMADFSTARPDQTKKSETSTSQTLLIEELSTQETEAEEINTREAVNANTQDKEQTNTPVTNQLEPGEVQPEGQYIATGILFADTLTKFLGKRKAKGSKGKDGTFEDLKNFVELVLHQKGTWKGKKGKKQSFQDSVNEVLISWLPSNKTIDLQGSLDIPEKINKTLTDHIQQVRTPELLTNKQTEYTKDEIDTIWAEIKEIKAVLKNTNKQHPRTVGKAEKQHVETQTNLQPEATENLNKITNYFKRIDRPNYDKLIEKN